MTTETILVPKSVRGRLDELWGPPSLLRDCSRRAEASLHLTEDSSLPGPTHPTQLYILFWSHRLQPQHQITKVKFSISDRQVRRERGSMADRDDLQGSLGHWHIPPGIPWHHGVAPASQMTLWISELTNSKGHNDGGGVDELGRTKMAETPG